MAAGFPGVALCADIEPAQWVRDARRPWSARGLVYVASLVPPGYPAYGRILHRAWSGLDPIPWSAIAARSGMELHAESRYNDLVGWHADADHQSPPAPYDPPEHGSLQVDECAAVASVLAAHTATPDECWFCMWEGYGSAWTVLNELAEHAPRVALEHRDCLLFRGPVAAATAFRSPPWFQSPTLWWPTDRAWCVASEVDEFSTYVAAAPDAVRALAAHPGLEVIGCSADQEVDPSPYSR